LKKADSRVNTEKFGSPNCPLMEETAPYFLSLGRSLGRRKATMVFYWTDGFSVFLLVREDQFIGD